MDAIWRVTQTPDLHQRWDLRFTSIAYLPRRNDSEPQRFRYATRLGFGLEIEGSGETVGAQAADGTRTSALEFGSEDRRSLIRSGSGYWKYEQGSDEVRFITGYDYQVRWGVIGRTFDRLVLFSGVADVCEWFDDSTGRYRIEVAVTNRIWGPLFGYRGSFDVEWIDAPDGPPPSRRPRREERRE